jgi:tetratricopeptide (TPR) repeat protein
MKRIPYTASADDLDGFAAMGMKRDALRLARQNLKNRVITAGLFNRSVNVILFQSDRLKSWSVLIEHAYARMSRREQGLARSWMFAYDYCLKDYARAARFIPRRFKGACDPHHLALATDTMLELGNRREARRLARRLPRAIREAGDPTEQAMLSCSLAEYLASEGKWNEAIRIWETVLSDSTFMENAVTGIMFVHVARALQTVHAGLQLLGKFKSQPDPQLEITLPGNEKVRLAKAERKLRRFEKLLERILPEKSWKELGIDPAKCFPY